MYYTCINTTGGAVHFRRWCSLNNGGASTFGSDFFIFGGGARLVVVVLVVLAGGAHLLFMFLSLFNSILMFQL